MTRQPAARKRGIRLVSHETGVSTDGIVCSAVSPRFTEWVSELLTELRPHTEQIIRHHAGTEDPWRASSAILTTTVPEWTTLGNSWSDDTAEAVGYTRALTALTLTYGDEDIEDLSPYHQQRHADLIDTTESVGTGRGSVNAGLGALAKGPVALHRELDDNPRTLTLLLDGPAWTNLADRRTGVRALAAIAVLADAFDVRLVASPGLRQHLGRRYPRWTSTHLDLTENRDRSHAQPRQDDHPAWMALRGLKRSPRKRQLLGSLTTARERTYRDLKQDHEVDIEAGTVSRYVLELEERGLVAIGRHGQYNTVRLTSLGETATEQFLTSENDLIHPDQRRLDACLTAAPHCATSTVSPRREGPPGETPLSIDARLAATGDPDTDDDYVKWLTAPENTPDTQLHQRFSRVAHDDSVTLVDDQPAAFDDGRVAYLSHNADEALVVLQWGGPLATLGRLAGALLSDKALSKILTPSRFGHEFEAIHGSDLDQAGPRILRRGHQVGWYSDEEHTYEAWRDRVTTVRDELLTRLADLVNSDDTTARSELFEDLHGLVASATHLYHAIGVDLTTTIRLPDTEALARNSTQRRQLCTFLAKTVPKQSVYGVHSGYRMLFEERPPKLRRRLPYDVEPDATMDLTMSWVLAGPTITDLRDEIEDALTTELTAVREAIAAGTETAPTLSIPVVDGTTYPAIRRVIENVAMTHDAQWTPHERQRLVRLCLRSFGPSDTTRRACPYDVMVTLLRALSESHSPTVAVFERAAATLSVDRFRPDLVPTATALYATLLRADEPLGRSELIERAGIAASSYDRRIGTVQALERVQAVQVDGHRRWVTTDEPSHPSPQPSSYLGQPPSWHQLLAHRPAPLPVSPATTLWAPRQAFWHPYRIPKWDRHTQTIRSVDTALPVNQCRTRRGDYTAITDVTHYSYRPVASPETTTHESLMTTQHHATTTSLPDHPDQHSPRGESQ